MQCLCLCVVICVTKPACSDSVQLKGCRVSHRPGWGGWVNFQLQLGRTISLLSRLNCTNFGPTWPFSTIFSRGGLTQTRGIKGWVNVQFRAMRTILQWPHLNWTTLPKLVDEQNLKFELFSTEKRRENIFQMIFNLRDQIFSAFSSYVRSQIDFWPWNY